MLDVINLSATGMAEIAESTLLNGCPHTFVNIVYKYFKTYNQLAVKQFSII
jgi:hypothetical protein